jgi:hypothetical protein
MWKANGKTTTLQLFLDSLSPKNMRDSLSGDKLNFGDLSLEEAMDLSRDRQILELGVVIRNIMRRVNTATFCVFQLQEFSLQLLHRKVQFTACGFFPLDFTLLYSVRF